VCPDGNSAQRVSLTCEDSEENVAGRGGRRRDMRRRFLGGPAAGVGGELGELGEFPLWSTTLPLPTE
jgi:hypothetical protein